MRIVIDLQGAQSISRFRGIGRYSLSLALAMARAARGHELWLVLNGGFPETVASILSAFAGLIPPERIRCFQIPLPCAENDSANAWRTRAAERIREAFLADLCPDVVFVSSLFEGMVEDIVCSVGLQQPELTTAVTLYDLIPLLNPVSYLGDPVIRGWYDRKIESLKKADLLLSISEYSKREAMEALGFAEANIVSISSAASEIFRPMPLQGEGLLRLYRRYGLAGPYLMYSGAFEARKNVPRLFEAFARLPASLRERHCLVCVGKIPEAERRHFLMIAEGLGIRRNLRLPGYVPDEDLVALYSNCALFVFPSLHEGFGLPALEAMSCGAPAIGSDSTSIPEVIGCAEALFPPASPEAMSRLMGRVLTDHEFSRFLQEHGLRQAGNFSWDASAAKALAGMEELVAGRSAVRQSVVDWSRWSREYGQRRNTLLDAVACLPEPYSDNDLRGAAAAIIANADALAPALRAGELPATIRWRIEGPFDSAYSLALLNRETARSLADLGHEVLLHSTDGPGDFPPSQEFLLANPDLARMHARGLEIPAEECQVASRNLYPPRVKDMAARLNLLHHYAWEESGFPQAWVDSFNENLQGITCLSAHVEKILIDHGVTVPLTTSGCGVDHWERIEADPLFSLEARSFRFLHVSSCFPRKGADALLSAYAMAFSDADDVSLVIKTFANPHNEIAKQLHALRQQRTDFPHVLLIEEEKMPEAVLKAVYRQCHCLVAPSRAEGFGLPLAEAMLSGLPVITTSWGGQADFCSEETAWLVDYSFAPAATHFQLHDSVWAEPEVAGLAGAMREVRDLPEEKRRERSARGRALLLGRFRWRDGAERLAEAARSWSKMPPPPVPRIGWVTTWNSRCGIAAYSAHLLRHLPGQVQVFACQVEETVTADGPEVERCWQVNCHADQGDDLTALSRAVARSGIDTLVIQFNYGFFHLGHLARFLEEQLAAGRVLVLMLHSTVDRVHLPQGRLAPLVPVLRRCQRICVHAIADLNRLKALGLVDNVTLFPHGIPDPPPQSAPLPAKPDDSWTIASYGFFLPHKGLLELIEAVSLLVGSGENVRLLMVNAGYSALHSASLIEQAHARVAELGLQGRVRIVSRYLADEESLALLREADLVVFPYQETGESSSAAARYGLATTLPVAVTPLPIFDDLGQAVWRLPGVTPTDIAEGIVQILRQLVSGTPAMLVRKAEADRWRESHRYSVISRRLHGMLVALARKEQEH